MRWIDRYDKENSIKRHNREPIAYKVSHSNVKFIIEEIKKNKTIIIDDLLLKLKNKFPDLDLSKMHVHRIIKDNNITLKLTRLRHEPKLRFGKEIDINKRIKEFYNEVKKYYIKYYNDFCKNCEILNINYYCKKILKKEIPFLISLWNDNIKNKFITYEGLIKQSLVYHFCKNNIDNNYDAIFIDDAHDFDSCMLQILLNDTTIPKIFIGDPKQSIYGFKGCINAFDYLPRESLNIKFYSTLRIGNPACQILCKDFKDLQMVTKNINETKYEYNTKFTINNNFTYLFRSWRCLLNTAKDMKNIWINNFEKQSKKMLTLIDDIQYINNNLKNQSNKMLTLIDDIQYMSDDEIEMRNNFKKKSKKMFNDDEIDLFDDDLPKFLSSLTKNELENLLDTIENNSVSFTDATCKMYTIYSYKGLEDDIIKIADDLDGDKEENLYYVALTRAKKIIIDS